MTFRYAVPDTHYRTLRLLSTRGHWALGLSPYHHGMRVRMGRMGLPPALLDFCLGHNPHLPIEVLRAVLRILEPLPEESTLSDIDAAFPWANTRPDLSLHLPRLLTNTNRGVEPLPTTLCPLHPNCPPPSLATDLGIKDGLRGQLCEGTPLGFDDTDHEMGPAPQHKH